MSSDEVVVDVRNLGKRYEIYQAPRDRLKQLVLPHLYRGVNRAGSALGLTSPRPAPDWFREFWALRGVSFQVRRGETFGVIGRNGSGKSTLLQILAGTLAQTTGTARIQGRIAALLELGSGFNPEFSGRDNVMLNGRILGLTPREIADRYEQIVEFADIGEFIDQPVKTYSSGMFVRLAFAVQAHTDASVIIIDEALAVGDVFFRQKCYARLEQLRSGGAAILLASHAMPEVEQFCERAILLDHGTEAFTGPATEATKRYYVLNQPQAHHNGDSAVATVQSSTSECSPRSRMQLPRPPPEACIDLTHIPQVTNGQARCTLLALTNAAGQPCASFRQGDVAVFHYEFELSAAVGVPICGLVISNDRGVIVHGKNAWQYDADIPASRSGDRVVCRQEIALQLGPGEYTFELGLVSVTPAEWARRNSMSHDDWASCHVTLCAVPTVGQFSVGLALQRGIPVLTHHGAADLPGSLATEVVRDVTGNDDQDVLVRE
jgi:lipopolysaccharide transport system ATP-binding protein